MDDAGGIVDLGSWSPVRKIHQSNNHLGPVLIIGQQQRRTIEPYRWLRFLCKYRPHSFHERQEGVCQSEVALKKRQHGCNEEGEPLTPKTYSGCSTFTTSALHFTALFDCI